MPKNSRKVYRSSVAHDESVRATSYKEEDARFVSSGRKDRPKFCFNLFAMKESNGIELSNVTSNLKRCNTMIENEMMVKISI